MHTQLSLSLSLSLYLSLSLSLSLSHSLSLSLSLSLFLSLSVCVRKRDLEGRNGEDMRVRQAQERPELLLYIGIEAHIRDEINV